MHNQIDELRQLSARIGADPLLVQGGGGNSSVKLDDILYVKASGTWLRDALDKELFVPLNLEAAREYASSGQEDYLSLRIDDLPGGNLRPSIETGMHAAMPHQYVMHTHPVFTIAATIIQDHDVGHFLDGLHWAKLPYIKPGAGLASAISGLVQENAPDIILLENHGLVVGGNSPEDVEQTLLEVEKRLSLPQMELNKDFEKSEITNEPDGYKWFENTLAKNVACSGAAMQKLTLGALVPDQIVYLGGAAVRISDTHELDEIRLNWKSLYGVEPGLVFVEGMGALVREDLTKGGLAMVDLLLQLAIHIPDNVALNTLTPENQIELLNWDAEKFRQAVDAERKG